MKKLILTTIAALTVTFGLAQTKVLCCSQKGTTQTATAKFASLAMDNSFRVAHAPIYKISYKAIGQALTYKTPDGKQSTAYLVKAKKPTNNYIIVIHEWWGLTDFIKRESDKLAKDLGNVNVLAIDAYDGKVATTREQAGQYMQAAKEDRIKAIIKGAITYAGPKARIATLGWCFGGGWSLQTGLMLGRQDAGTVMYYGMPETDISKLKTLHADVLGIFANKDAWITPKVADKFVADMKAAGKKLYIYRYDADHAFANPVNDVYNDTAKKDAYAKTLAFLKARLK
jgi:carboxymethylenebutenolidase